jgi:hypothetical protein
MLASYEGIGAKAARSKLYQPGSNSIDPDEFLAFVGGGFCGVNPFEQASPASSTQPSPSGSDENLKNKTSNEIAKDDKEHDPLASQRSTTMERGKDEGSEEAFGLFEETDDVVDEPPPDTLPPPPQLPLTSPAASSSSASSFSSSPQAWPRPRVGSSGSSGSAGSEEGSTGDEDDETPKMVRVNSLDCVKSALRVPLPDTIDDDSSIWTWSGQLKSPSSYSSTSSSSTLTKRSGGGSTAALSSAAQKLDSNAEAPRTPTRDEFWRLCVALEKPNGLNGERKSRFSSRSTNGGHESGVGFSTLVMWIGAFFVVAYLVLDSGSSVMHSDTSPSTM